MLTLYLVVQIDTENFDGTGEIISQVDDLNTAKQVRETLATKADEGIDYIVVPLVLEVS